MGAANYVTTGSREPIVIGNFVIDTINYNRYTEHFLNNENNEIIIFLTTAKDIKESKVVSPSDVKLSSQAVTAKYTLKPTTPPSTQRNDTAATLDVSSETAPTTKTPVTNNISNSTVEEPRRKFKQPTDTVEVARHKKSCCVLM